MAKLASTHALALTLALAPACGGGWQNNPDDPLTGTGPSAGSAAADSGALDPDAALPDAALPDGALAPDGASPEPEVTDFPKGLHVLGNRIVDENGTRIFLRGVNRSGTEYQCIKSMGFFDGPNDEASVRAMASWKINAVRVPLNEACWLGTNGAPARYSLDLYKAAIRDYVKLLHKYKLVPILDLHWAAPEGATAIDLKPMPNADHSSAFWSDVASTFSSDTGVVFELYNEPFPDCNRDTDAGWKCWRDGCAGVRLNCYSTMVTDTYTAAGMQELVSAIRATGATQLILAGGLQYSNALTQWAQYKPEDALNNLAPTWHIYNYNACKSLDCYNGVPAAVAAQYPVVATEIGENDCGGAFITPLMAFLDEFGAGYLAWSWNAAGACAPAVPAQAGQPAQAGRPYSLITDDWQGTPNGAFAQTFHDHVVSMVR
jgi:endoglucanase